jgi:nitrite reductase/ring-hydroxylating ferredoxin subunit
MIINETITVEDLAEKLNHFWKLSGEKIRLINSEYDTTQGSPVFTVAGKYSTRGWTEWTQGFQYGSAILQFDATGDEEMLAYGKKLTREQMASHVGHFGVHDHGFNNVSTYGNLLRLMMEGKIEHNEWEREFYEMALKMSGAVQARRWTRLKQGGYIHSFNGPHSLFVDTVRTVRSLMISHYLDHAIWTENDVEVNLFERGIDHLVATANYCVFYGEGRDSYDIRGRTAHECIFNVKDGNYRCPNAQQGYSGFTTWTRGLAWAITGFAEELEFFLDADDADFENYMGKSVVTDHLLKAAKAVCDFYIEHTPTDGIPYWDTGAPNLHKLDNYLDREADPYNDHEPVDSSAAAIAAQGFLRLGEFLKDIDPENAKKYKQAGLTIVNRLFEEPYLSTNDNHQGLILHSIYHQPNGWDHVPDGSNIANGESSMWGDYHAREVALYLSKQLKDEQYYTFYGCLEKM